MLNVTSNIKTHDCPVCGDVLRSEGERYDLKDIFAMWRPIVFPAAVVEEHLALSQYTELYSCPSCKMEIFLPQVIGLPSFYAAASANDCKGGAGAYYEEMKWDFEEALYDVKHGMTLVELGCGPGNFLKMSSVKGGQPVGIEFNPYALTVARSHGLKVYDEYGIPEHELKLFDAAFSFHVLEHVSDPLSFLASMVAYVKPGGLVGVSVPNQDGPIRLIKPCAMNMPPHHASRWRLNTFEVAAQRLGLTIRRVAYEPLLLENHSYYSVYWPRFLLPGGSLFSRVARTLISLPLRLFFGLLKRIGFRHFKFLRGQSIYVVMERSIPSE